MSEAARHYCTYFDHRYLSRGLVLLESLRRHSSRPVVVWVLCLSEECFEFLQARKPEGIRPIRLQELEEFNPELAAARSDRSLVEFYFTCSPCWPRYLLMRHGLAQVTYLDADLAFFEDPEILLKEIGDAPVAITPHRFSKALAGDLSKYGLFNVGWLTFRHDAQGRETLEWWRARCLEWCHDRLEGERYADQKYLDRFPRLFAMTHVVRHPGANVAAWNCEDLEFSVRNERVFVDGAPLLFFHFQGVRKLGDTLYDSNFSRYRTRLGPTLRDRVFRPYLRRLSSVEKEVGSALELAPATALRGPTTRGLNATVVQWLKRQRDALRGNLVRL